MNRHFTTSLCISTYNRPNVLELCLMTVISQREMPDEIVIGDDGSTAETKKLIDEYKRKYSLPIKHVWHPDEGFRLAAIRNKSFAEASGDYIIQIDGDVLMHKYFIEDHIKFARRNAFVAGTRTMLPEITTQQLLEHEHVDAFRKDGMGKSYNAMRIPLLSRLIYHLQKGVKQAPYVLGANMAFWKDDLLKVNGYNEDYKGWGKEDNDLSIRLCNGGVALHFVRFASIIYHLHHAEAARETISNNELLLTQAVKEKQTFVQNGMNKYL